MIVIFLFKFQQSQPLCTVLSLIINVGLNTLNFPEDLLIQGQEIQANNPSRPYNSVLIENGKCQS